MNGLGPTFKSPPIFEKAFFPTTFLVGFVVAKLQLFFGRKIGFKL